MNTITDLAVAPPELQAELPEGGLALLLGEAAATAGRHGLIHVAADERQAERLASAISAFRPDIEVLVLPPWDNLPYDRAPPSRSVVGRRIYALHRLAGPARQHSRILLTTVEAMVQRLPPGDAWRDAGIEIEVGGLIEADSLEQRLLAAGYWVDERVDEPGEVAFREAVVDVFPGHTAQPYRLEIENGRVRAIRCYDPLNQRSIGDVPRLLLLPVAESLRPGTGPHPGTLSDVLPQARLSLADGVSVRLDDWLAEVEEAYRTCSALNAEGRSSAVLPSPQQLYLSRRDWEQVVGRQRPAGFEGEPVQPLAWPGHGEGSPSLRDFVAGRLATRCRIAVAGVGPKATRRLARLVGRRAGHECPILENWAAVAALPPASLAAVDLPVPSGFARGALVVLTAAEIEGTVPLEATASVPGEVPAALLPELRCGDTVVHAEHGIARLEALQAVGEGDASSECLVLQFADNGRLLVPASDIATVWRYGSSETAVTLDRLKGDAWKRRREQVAIEIRSAAEALVRHAQAREAARGPEIGPDPGALRRFAARFPWTASDDQRRAIDATLADLRGPRPMDRLICGDVGFGKTEVALRAAAAVAFSGKQVAFLAPTTLLVRQHLRALRHRFASTGVRVEELSRLNGKAAGQGVRAAIRSGELAVVVGTHSLLSPDVRFADLGLVIVDEEQRFGARHKHRLRELGRDVHALTLTATPIPQTLQAALVGLRDCSVIATPPMRRRPVRTAVLAFDAAVIRQALLREHRRAGQSFVVCPRIADLEPMCARLSTLCPELRIAVAHGRMRSNALDETVLAFAGGDHDVLLTTSVIESGLDIPNANTMLIWRPDRFGLAELHQLRGRVGRGRQQAVCYLITDAKVKPTRGAAQRLRTLQAFEALGAGFQISLHDLDQRGAGALIGHAQAGHVEVIGLELHQHLLERAVRAARGEAAQDAPEVALNLGLGFRLPEAYVPEPDVRLALYRSLSRIARLDQLEAWEAEIDDRFGLPAEAVATPLAMVQLRLLARQLGITAVDAGPRGIAITMAAGSPALASIRQRPDFKVRKGRALLATATENPNRRLQIVLGLLADMAGQP